MSINRDEKRRRGGEEETETKLLGGIRLRGKSDWLSSAKTPCGFRVGLARDSPLGRKGDDWEGFDEMDDEQ